MPPFSSPISQVPYPALFLYPLNDSFIPKHISLLSNQHVKIGRQTNAKTVPAERNGYFDSKVLSRQHAEVWEESGKIYIKDVKSSNGTFINGERLSPEGLESEPFELKSDDIVEFGIDIVGEDNKTIIHHKVAARVVCVLTEQDAQAAARAEASQNPPNYGTVPGQNGAGVGSSANMLNFAGGSQGGNGANGVGGPQRRSTMQQQGLVGMGGMGGSARPPGKSGLTFDHILSRLQGEIQKSRETGADLHSLSGAMNDIHETLGGNLPPNLPHYPSTLPPVVPPQSKEAESNPPAAPAPPTQDSASALSELQAQLHDTQLSLATYVEKIRALEGMLAEHEAIKREVSSMRDMMEERKREMELSRVHAQSPTDMRQHLSIRDDDDDDDARSIATIVPHELERVDEEDEEQMAAEEEEEEERRRRREELGRPRTPEPTGMGMVEDDDEQDAHHAHAHQAVGPSHIRSQSPLPSAPSITAPTSSVPDDLIQRMTTLATQLESALELSRSLEAQHVTAQSTISVLESKVIALESLVQSTQSQVQAQAETQLQLVQQVEAKQAEESAVASTSALEVERRERESLTTMLNEWKKDVEGQWSGVQEEWTEERERLKRAKEEFEARVRTVEDNFGSTVTKVESGLASLASFQVQHQLPNGGAKLNGGGLVTPPSPRSLSAESTRPRQRKRRANSTRGRSRSRSTSVPPINGNGHSSLSSMSREHDEESSTSSRVHRRSPWMTDDSSADESEDHHGNGVAKPSEGAVKKLSQGIQYPITPEPSLRDQPVTGYNGIASMVAEPRPKEQSPPRDMQQLHNMSTVVGVLVLSVAAAAVIWRVKPDTGI